MTGLHTALAALLDEKDAEIAEINATPDPLTGRCSTMAAYVLTEDLRALLDEHQATPSEAPTPLSGAESHPDDQCPEHGPLCTGPTCCCRDKHRDADLPVATDSTTADVARCGSCGRPLKADRSGYTGVSAYCEPCAREVYGDEFVGPSAPEPSDRAGLSEIRARLERYQREWLWREADEEHVARWGVHIGQMLHRLPKDGQTTDMQASIEAMIADLGILADRLAVAEQEHERHRWQWAAWTSEAVQRAEAARDEAATLRAQVAAVIDVITRLDRQVPGIRRAAQAALDDPAQVVQRIKDEAAADERQAGIDLIQGYADRRADTAFTTWFNEVTGAHSRGRVEGLDRAAEMLRERGRRLRDGEPS